MKTRVGLHGRRKSVYIVHPPNSSEMSVTAIERDTLQRLALSDMLKVGSSEDPRLVPVDIMMPDSGLLGFGVEPGPSCLNGQRIAFFDDHE